MIATGTPAPDFELPDQDGNNVSLSGLRGGWVVVFFYPKADTPGCTKQACGIRDHRKSMFGHDSAHPPRAQRSTFVIDPEGVVRHVIEKASPKTHDEQVLAALASLAPAA